MSTFAQFQGQLAHVLSWQTGDLSVPQCGARNLMEVRQCCITFSLQHDLLLHTIIISAC